MVLTFTGHTVCHDGIARKAGAHGCVPNNAAHLLTRPIVWEKIAQKSETARLITSSSNLQVERLGAKEPHYWTFLQVHLLNWLMHQLVSGMMC